MRPCATLETVAVGHTRRQRVDTTSRLTYIGRMAIEISDKPVTVPGGPIMLPLKRRAKASRSSSPSCSGRGPWVPTTRSRWSPILWSTAPPPGSPRSGSSGIPSGCAHSASSAWSRRVGGGRGMIKIGTNSETFEGRRLGRLGLRCARLLN